MMSVRRATAADAALIVRLNAPVQAVHVAAVPGLFKAAGALPLEAAQKIIAGASNHVFIADVGGEAAGYAYAEVRREPETPLTFERTTLYLHHISVEPKFRRHGVGHALIEAVRGEAKAAGIALLTLAVWHFNEPARAFFAREGFSVFHERMESRA